MPAPTLVWFRNDLRLADNPALTAAVARGGPLLPVYIHDDAAAGAWRLGGAARWWLHHALQSLADDLDAAGSRLTLRAGNAWDELSALVAASGAAAVFWNRRYEPWAVAQDRAIKAGLRRRGIAARSFNGSLCREPWDLLPGDARPVTRFSFFAGLWLERGPPPAPLPAPALPPVLAAAVPSAALEELALLPRRPDWAADLRATWRPGEAAARAASARFLAGDIGGYRERRHRPGRVEGTSRLSPHLRFGEVSPRQAWHAARAAAAPVARDRLPAFERQLVWREFAYHLLWFFPDLPDAPMQRATRLPQADDPAAFRAWCRGETGYPIVDAGLRELWRTGYMHNRVRMIAASFLTKDLLVPWQRGAAWFWDTLCDADLANNSMGWQWVAGCGADSASYFRMLNPVAQGRRFDPDGAYVRRWVPELARLPDAFIHCPSAAPANVLAYVGLELGRDYPEPLVDHGPARERALAAHAAAGYSLRRENETA